MKNNVFITISTILLIVFCACNNRSAKIEESIETTETTKYQIPDSILIDYNKVIDNFYKYRNEDSLLVGTTLYYWQQCFYYMDSLLIFNFDKGTIQKVEKPRNNNMDTIDTLIETGEMNEQEYKDKVNSIYYLDAVKLLNL